MNADSNCKLQPVCKAEHRFCNFELRSANFCLFSLKYKQREKALRGTSQFLCFSICKSCKQEQRHAVLFARQIAQSWWVLICCGKLDRVDQVGPVFVMLVGQEVELPARQPGLPHEFHGGLSQQQGPPHGIFPISRWHFYFLSWQKSGIGVDGRVRTSKT